MRTIKLIIGFQGTNYEGWQSQCKGKTVQEAVEKALARICKGPVDLISSSRTDSGVHAKAMAAHFKTTSDLPDAKIKTALNYYLPKDILIERAKTVEGSFHARYGAKSKVYRYQIWNSPTRPLFQAPFVLWHPKPLRMSAMKIAAKHLVGRHDFTSFKDNKDPSKSNVRTVKGLSIAKKGPLMTLSIEADGFLTHMVRIIAGTLIEVGRGRIRPEAIPGILRAKKRDLAGPTAKAHALTLMTVKY